MGTTAPAARPDGGGAPAGPEWMRDQDFLWCAGTELLLALGVPETVAGRTGQIRAVVTELAALDARHPEGAAWSGQDLETRNAAVDRLVLEGHPLAASVIERLEAEDIRTEVVGVRRSALRPALEALMAAHRDGAWRELERQDALMSQVLAPIAASTGLCMPAEKTGWGDAGRISAVLSRMPRETLKRITRTTNRFLLRIAVFTMLRTMRVGSGQEEAG